MLDRASRNTAIAGDARGDIKRGIILKYGQIKTAGYESRPRDVVRSGYASPLPTATTDLSLTTHDSRLTTCDFRDSIARRPTRERWSAQRPVRNCEKMRNEEWKMRNKEPSKMRKSNKKIRVEWKKICERKRNTTSFVSFFGICTLS